MHIMRVLYLLHDSSMSGSTISFLNMLQGLILKGVKPFVVIPIYNKEIVDFFNRNGVSFKEVYMPLEIYPRTSNLVDYLKYPIRFVKFCWKLCYSRYQLDEIIRQFKPNLIHTNSGVIHSGNKLSKKYNLPHVWHIREYQDANYKWKIYPSKNKFLAYLKQSHVITISQDLLAHYDLLSSSKAVCIYNGILNKNTFNFNEIKDNYFLMVTRVSREKLLEDTINAFHSFYKIYPQYKLKIIGDCESVYLSELKQLCEELSINEAVEFIGYKGKKTVLDCMSKAQALIVPSKFEGFGRMTAEALFMGCIVIGRNSGGTKEIIDSTGGGIYFDSIDSLVDVMIGVVNQRYKFDSDKVHQCVNEKFTIESNIDNVYNFYNVVLK